MLKRIIFSRKMIQTLFDKAMLNGDISTAVYLAGRFEDCIVK